MGLVGEAQFGRHGCKVEGLALIQALRDALQPTTPDGPERRYSDQPGVPALKRAGAHVNGRGEVVHPREIPFFDEVACLPHHMEGSILEKLQVNFLDEPVSEQFAAHALRRLGDKDVNELFYVVPEDLNGRDDFSRQIGRIQPQRGCQSALSESHTGHPACRWERHLEHLRDDAVDEQRRRLETVHRPGPLLEREVDDGVREDALGEPVRRVPAHPPQVADQLPQLTAERVPAAGPVPGVALRIKHATGPGEVSQMFKPHAPQPRNTGDMTNYRPEGYSTLTPMIVVNDGAAAIDFYESVFGAQVVARMTGPDGKIWHCELQLESGRFQVMDANEMYRMVTLETGDDAVPYSLAIYVGDCDAVVAKAEAAGATVREPLGDFDVTGDRFASIRDPFGVRWTVMTRKVAKTDAEIQAGLDAMVASMG